MRTAEFNHMLVARADEYSSLKAAGIRLYPDPQQGWFDDGIFTSAEIELGAGTAETLSRLSLATLDKLQGCLDDPEVDAEIKQAGYILQLRRQSEKPVDGFYLPGNDRPFTWSMEPLCRDEIVRLSAALKEKGVTSTKVGIEIEFGLAEKAIDGFIHWLDVKKDAFEELAEQMRLLPQSKRQEQDEKIHKIARFNAREMLMYDMIERDPRTKDLLEPLFGTGNDGNGYYDGANTLELKIKPTHAADIAEVHKTVLDVLYEKAGQYGLAMISSPEHHVNNSFWTTSGNLFQSGHPEYDTKTKKITEGIARGLYDFLPVIAGEEAMNDKARLNEFCVGFSRKDILRLASNRLEVRVAARGAHQHIGMIVATAMASALHGLSNDKEFEKEAALEGNATVHFSDTRYKVLAHMISNAVVGEDGTLTVPADYVADKISDIGHCLGLQENPPGRLDGMFGGEPRYAPDLKKFLNRIKIDRSGEEPKIVWPETADGEYRITLPSVNWDRLPGELQQRITQGMDYMEMMEECMKYVAMGADMPKPELTLCIDTGQLAKNIKCMGISKKYTVATGYDLHALDADPKATLLTSRISRCRDGAALTQCTSPEFQKAFRDCLAQRFPGVGGLRIKQPAALPQAWAPDTLSF